MVYLSAALGILDRVDPFGEDPRDVGGVEAGDVEDEEASEESPHDDEDDEDEDEGNPRVRRNGSEWAYGSGCTVDSSPDGLDDDASV